MKTKIYIVKISKYNKNYLNLYIFIIYMSYGYIKQNCLS